MEGCIPVSATSADTTPPQTTTTPLALAVAIASTSSDMSLTAALESSCTLSDPSSPADATLATGAAAGAADLHRPSPSSPLVVASAADAPSCGGGCTGSSSSSAAEAGAGEAPTMTTIDESLTTTTTTTTTSHNHTHNTNNKTDKSKKKRKVVRIDIYSDTTCPWCYITKKRLEKAIHAFQLASSSSSSSDSASIDADSSVVVHEGCSSNPHPPPPPPVKPSAQSSSPDPSSSIKTPPTNPTLPPREEEIYFDIHWRPFQLDPQAPREPIRKTKMYHRKFGTEKTLQIQERVVAAGKAEGVMFLYSDQSLYSNTIDSHRVLRFARERLGRLPLGTTREEDEDVVVEVEEGRRKMVDSGNALNGSYHSQAQDQEGYFPTYTPSDRQEEESYFSHSDQGEEEEEEEVDEWGARMEDAMVDELFRSHFERGECSEFETLKSCARSVLVQTAAFSAAAAAALSLPSLPLSSPPPSSSSSASSLPESNNTITTKTNNTNESTEEKEHRARLLKAKEQELIDQQLEELDLYLHSDEGLDEVMEEIRVAKEDLGMQGVPMIVIQNEYLLSGAQTTNTFVQVLQRVI